MPSYECFDIILNTLRNEPASVPCIFTCQMGKGRTTAGMVITSLIKEMVIVKDLRYLNKLKLIDTDVVKGIIKNKFEIVPGNSQYDDDPLVRGEFELMKELMSTFSQASEAKRKIDIIIDKCGPNPR